MSSKKYLIELFENNPNLAYTEAIKLGIANGYNKFTCSKYHKLYRIKNDMMLEHINREHVEYDYCVNFLSIEDISSKYSLDQYTMKDYLSAKDIYRKPQDYKNFHNVKPWNAGLNKDNNDVLKRLSIERTGSGNPMYGKDTWNKGLTIENEKVAAAVAKSHSVISNFSEERKLEMREKQANAKRGKFGPLANNWKGGTKTQGYERGSYGNYFFYKHRKVAQDMIGDRLGDNQVHHIDKNRTNNEPSNLIVINQKDHLKLHVAMRKDAELNQIQWLKDNNIEHYWLGDVCLK